MWFKNLQIYRLPPDWQISAEALETQLGRNRFQACGNQDMQSRGWASPCRDERLAYGLERQYLLAACTETKLLPAGVINQVAAERAEEIQEQQDYPVGRKQLREIKERVREELLPRAFTRRRSTFVWLDTAHGWLAVDASSGAKADEVLELLGKSLDEFPLTRLHTQLSPTAAMTDWLVSGEAPADFTVDRDCELRSPLEEKATVRYVRHPLDGTEIREHIVAGKVPTRLALTWKDRLSFVLTDKLEIKRLAFLDIIKEEAETQAETAAEQFDADFALMTGELANFLPDLVAALGGEASLS